MFTTPHPVYPGKVRGYTDKVFKNVNIVVFVGMWTLLVVTINSVRDRARRTVDDFWSPTGTPTVSWRLAQRLDASACEYQASVTVGGFDVAQTISAANRGEVFAEGAGQIRDAIFLSSAAVFVSALNRVLYNYNWHTVSYGADSNFYAGKGYFLLTELVLITSALVTLAQPQELASFLEDYIRHCGGDDIPHLFSAPPFVTMFVAHSVTLAVYALNGVIFLMHALRSVRRDVKAAWADVEQVIADESCPNHEDRKDTWSLDGLPGRPLIEHAEGRLATLIDGRPAVHGFTALKGLRTRLWEAHGFGQKRRRHAAEQPDDRPGELKLDQLVVRDSHTHANGVYSRLHDPPDGGWPADVAVEKGVWSNSEHATHATHYIFWLLADAAAPEEGGDCWLIYDRLGHPARDPRGPPAEDGRTVLCAQHVPSPVGVVWESSEGASATRVTAEVDTPRGPGTILQPAGFRDPEAGSALPNHWWVRLTEGHQAVAGSLSPRANAADLLLRRDELKQRKSAAPQSPSARIQSTEPGAADEELLRPLRREGTSRERVLIEQ